MTDTAYTGTDNLEVIAEAVNDNRFLLDLVSAELPPDARMVDFGAAIGAFAQELTCGGYTVTCVEPDRMQPAIIALPFLPSVSRVVRLTGNMGTITPARPVGIRVREVMDGHWGPIRSLSFSGLAEVDETLLLAYGWAPDPTGSRAEFTTRSDGFVSCPLRRAVAGPLVPLGPSGQSSDNP